jgi:hypothetical protein
MAISDVSNEPGEETETLTVSAFELGAGNGIRTHDPLLGKQMLYP